MPSPASSYPTNKIASFLVITVGVLVFLTHAPMVHADIPGIELSDTIDLSPGVDAYASQGFQLNHATHKLYVSGRPADPFNRNCALKVIDTASGGVIAGIDLGR